MSAIDPFFHHPQQAEELFDVEVPQQSYICSRQFEVEAEVYLRGHGAKVYDPIHNAFVDDEDDLMIG